MPRIFISHSSKNTQYSNKINDWLDSNGFELSFLDYDKESGIPVGADWERVLYDEIERSQAIIIILTPDWQASKWCFSEYTQARALGKAIYPLIFASCDEQGISGAIQHLDLSNDSQEAYKQLLKELTTLALNTQEGFEWDKTRSPYPGMLSFEWDDAAIFFGRDDDTLRVIERLNARSTQGGSRLLALLGASGSGKSSLLKAGVLPRLGRDQHHWIILPIFRPKLRPVRELAITLATMLDQIGKVNDYYQQLMGTNLNVFLTEIADKLQQQARQFDTTILISVDQSEELFSTAETKEAAQFFNIITQLKHKESPWLCIFTLRSDFLGYLQNAEHLKTDFTEISLKPMPLSRIDQIIRGPAKVDGLKIDPELIAVATEDAKTQDALPLLAFALRQLYERFGDDGDLTLDEYQRLGNEKKDLNPLENAVSQAADDALQQSKPDEQTLKALREAFIPAMVRVNDQGEYVRRPANWEKLPPKALPLLEQLAKVRLLSIKQNRDSKIVEVSHEALLRKWPLLQTWLSEEHEFLVGKDQLERSLQDWQNCDSKDKKQALLQGLPLHRAQQWLLEHPNQLDDERGYIQASLKSASMRQWIVSGSIIIGLVIAAILGGIAYISDKEKKQQTAIAEERGRMSAANTYAARIGIVERNALKGDFPQAESDLKDLAMSPDVSGSFEWRYLWGISNRNDIAFDTGLATGVAFVDDRHIVFGNEGNHLVGLDIKSGQQVWEEEAHQWGVFKGVASLAYSRSTNEIATAGDGDSRIKIWDAKDGALKREFQLKGGWNRVVALQLHFSEDGKRLAALLNPDQRNKSGFSTLMYISWSVVVLDAATGSELATFNIDARSISLSPDGNLIAMGRGRTIEIYSVDSQESVSQIELQRDYAAALAFSPDSHHLAIGGEDITLWDVDKDQQITFFQGHSEPILDLAFSPSGAYLASASADGTSRLWDLGTLSEVDAMFGHRGAVTALDFSPDSQRLTTISADGQTRIWKVADLVNQWQANGSVISLSPDAETMAVWDDSWRIGRVVVNAATHELRLMDLVTGQEYAHKRFNGSLDFVQYSKDGHLLAVGDGYGFYLVDAKNLSLVVELKTNSSLGVFLPRTGDYVSVGEKDLIIVATSGESHKVELPDQITPPKAACHLDGNGVLVVADNLSVHLIDTVDWKLRARIVGGDKNNAIRSLLCSPTGGSIVVITENGAASLLDGATLEHQIYLGKDSSYLRWTPGAFAPNGEFLAMVRSDRSVDVWDLHKQEKFKLVGHTSAVNTIDYSPDGQRIATGGGDQFVRVWDASTGRQLLSLESDIGRILDVRFSLRGDTLISTHWQDEFRRVRLWHTPSDSLVNLTTLPVEDGRTLFSETNNFKSTSSATHSLTTKNLKRYTVRQALRETLESPSGNIVKAEEQLRAAVALDPEMTNDVEALIGRARNDFQFRIQEHAKVLVEEASDLIDGALEFDKAIQLLNRAISMSPKFQDAFFKRGLANYYSGDKKQARDDWKRTVELGPRDFFSSSVIEAPFANANFNLACMASLDASAEKEPGLQQLYVEEAAQYLKQASVGGKKNLLYHIENDSDLAFIRNAPQVNDLIEELRE